MFTFIDEETQYPYVTASPAPGKIVANVGPKGMAGPNQFFRSTYYTFTILTPGVNYATALIVFDTGGPLSSNPLSAGFTYGYNVTNMTNNGIIAFFEPNIWAMTGTLTVTQTPDPLLANQYMILSGMDYRTSMGASGTIQLIAAGLVHNYNVSPLPPPQDGSATVLNYRNGLHGGKKTVLEFIPAPEPGQIALMQTSGPSTS